MVTVFAFLASLLTVALVYLIGSRTRGSRVVSELPKDQQDKNGREFTLRFSGSEKPDLVFDCQGQGWFEADCDIIVTKES